jgi:hypothetical protein
MLLTDKDAKPSFVVELKDDTDQTMSQVQTQLDVEEEAILAAHFKI